MGLLLHQPYQIYTIYTNDNGVLLLLDKQKQLLQRYIIRGKSEALIFSGSLP